MNAIVEPTRHRLSIDDFERLVTAGILAEDSRVELIEGGLIDLPPIGPGHESVSVRLTRLLVRSAGDDAIVSVTNPMRLPPWSMPQPDFLLLKPRVYASHGVREYWVVDVDARRLHSFREPVAAEGRYASMYTLDAPFTIAASALPQVSLRSDEIWR